MSLKPGSPKYDPLKQKYVWPPSQLADSMAQEMEDQMEKVYKALKNQDLPTANTEDRLMLFSAISRGILYYLERHAGDLIQDYLIKHTSGTQTATTHSLSGLEFDIIDENLP
jgi:hypothetical protein